MCSLLMVIIDFNHMIFRNFPMKQTHPGHPCMQRPRLVHLLTFPCILQAYLGVRRASASHEKAE